MIRVALYILSVGLLAFAAAWLADRPGEIVLSWQGWHIETTVMVAAVGFVVLFAAVWVLWALLRLLVAGPSAMSGFFRGRRHNRGFRAISRGMVAAAAGDARLARHAAKEAGKFLRDEPLTLLLEAQSAQLAGDRKGARAAFESMVERPDTELLGLRGLYIEAERAGDEDTARACVERAVARAPGLAWAAGALLEFQTRDRDWAAALSTVERNAEHRLVDRKSAKRTRAVLLTAEALEVEEADPERAMALALEAHKLAPELVPAAVVAARQAAASGSTRQATKIVEKSWRLSPHPDLAEVYMHARPGDSARDRLKRARTLHDRMPNNLEGRIAMAIAAIEAREWGQARAALEPLARSMPTQRVCMLMADIAEGETGDAGSIREWLARAVRAPRDPAWTADGYVSDQWAPVSPVSGRLDAFEWKVPHEAIAPPEHAPEPPAPAAPLPAPVPAVPPPASPVPVTDAAQEEVHEPEAAIAPEPPPADTPADEPGGPDRPILAPAGAEHARDEDAPRRFEPLDAKPFSPSAAAPAETATIAPETSGPEPAPQATEATGEVSPASPPPAPAPSGSTSGAVQVDAEDREAPAEEPSTERPAGPLFGLARPPDDPGPPPREEAEPRPKRRFGLF